MVIANNPNFLRNDIAIIASKKKQQCLGCHDLMIDFCPSIISKIDYLRCLPPTKQQLMKLKLQFFEQNNLYIYKYLWTQMINIHAVTIAATCLSVLG